MKIILFLSANPAQTDPLELIKESNLINQKIRSSAGGRELFKLEQRHDISIKWLIEELLNYNPQILHFSGHGSKKSALIFKNEDTGQIEEVPPLALSNLFKVLGKKIDLVFLNACYSENQARAIAKHVNCVIGMSDAINDATAIEFASMFYLSLGFNKSVREAFDIAIVQLGLLSLSGDAIPKLIVKKGIDPSKIFMIANKLIPERFTLETKTALDIPKLREAIEFLFGEGTIILQEQKKHKNNDKSKLDAEIKNQNHSIDESQDLLDSKDEIFKQYISFENWIEFESKIKHLMDLININTKNYYNAKEQYAMWTSTLAPPIVMHTLERSETEIVDTINRLIDVLTKIFNKKIIIRNV